MAGPTSKALARREQILRGAAACFRRSGYRATTIADICAAAQVSPGHLYYYFRSKEQIVGVMLDQVREQGVREGMRLAERADGLDHLLSPSYVACLNQEEALYLDHSTVLELYGVAWRKEGPITGKIQLHFRTTSEVLRAVLEGARRHGRLRPDARLDYVLDLLTMYLGTVGLARICEPDFTEDRYRAALNQALAPYLLGPPLGSLSAAA